MSPLHGDGGAQSAQTSSLSEAALSGSAYRQLQRCRRAAFLIVVQQGFLDSVRPVAHFVMEVDLVMRLLLSCGDWFCPMHDKDDDTLCRWAAQLSRLSWCQMPSLPELFDALHGCARNRPVLRCRRKLFEHAVQSYELRFLPNCWAELSAVARADRGIYSLSIAAGGLGDGRDLTFHCLVWLLRRRGYVGLREFYPLVRLGRAQRLLIRARHFLTVLYAPGRLLRPNAEVRRLYVEWS